MRMIENGWEQLAQLAHDLATAIRAVNDTTRPMVACPHGEFVEVRPYDDLLARYDVIIAGSQP